MERIVANLASNNIDFCDLNKELEQADKIISQGNLKAGLEIYEDLALAFREKGDIAGAVGVYEKIIDLQKDNINAYLSLGRLYRKLKKFTEAKDAVREVIRRDLKNTEALTEYGLICFDKFEIDSAIMSFEKIIPIAPDIVIVRVKLAESYKIRRRMEECASQYYAAAEIYFKEGKIEEAREMCDKVLEIDSFDSRAIALKRNLDRPQGPSAIPATKGEGTLGRRKLEILPPVPQASTLNPADIIAGEGFKEKKSFGSSRARRGAHFQGGTNKFEGELPPIPPPQRRDFLKESINNKPGPAVPTPASLSPISMTEAQEKKTARKESLPVPPVSSIPPPVPKYKIKQKKPRNNTNQKESLPVPPVSSMPPSRPGKGNKNPNLIPRKSPSLKEENTQVRTEVSEKISSNTHKAIGATTLPVQGDDRIKSPQLSTEKEKIATPVKICKESALKYEKEGKYSKAVAEYRKALKISPDDPVIYELIGEIFQKIYKNDSFIMWFSRAGDCYRKRKDFAEAIKIYEKILKSTPDDIGILKKMSEIYSEAGIVDKAIEISEKLLKIYEKEELWDIVVILGERIFSLDPSDQKMKDYLIDIYQKLLEKDPDNMEIMGKVNNLIL